MINSRWIPLRNNLPPSDFICVLTGMIVECMGCIKNPYLPVQFTI